MPSIDPDWWKTIFDELYLVTDARSIDDREATRREVDSLLDLVDIAPGEPVLDLCGGQGRHALELARRNLGPVTVLDYSLALLEHARNNGCGNLDSVRLCRGDSRRVGFGDQTFSHVLILGSSFGYFEEETENRAILDEAYRVLTPGGTITLELPNREYALANLAVATWHEANEDIVVCRGRTILDPGIAAREIILSRSRGLLRENRYFMRLFRPDEIEALLEQVGFSGVRVVLADPGGSCPTRGMMASRMTTVAQKHPGKRR